MKMLIVKRMFFNKLVNHVELTITYISVKLLKILRNFRAVLIYGADLQTCTITKLDYDARDVHSPAFNITYFFHLFLSNCLPTSSQVRI